MDICKMYMFKFMFEGFDLVGLECYLGVCNFINYIIDLDVLYF